MNFFNTGLVFAAEIFILCKKVQQTRNFEQSKNPSSQNGSRPGKIARSMLVDQAWARESAEAQPIF